MRIKHKNTNHIIDISYSDWKNEYLKNNKYHNYEIINYNRVCELYEINPKTGKNNFKKLIDSKEALELCRSNPEQFYNHGAHKNSDLYDDNLIIKKDSKEFKKRFNTSGITLKLKAFYETIINSPISKLTANLITTVIGGLLVLVIWAVFKEQLINLFNNIF